MQILILTYGSRGDVQPYVALGTGLRQAGHDVTLATSTRFRDFVLEHGLRYAPMSDDMLAILDTDQGRKMIESTTNAFQAVRHTLRMLKQVGPMQRAMLEECWHAAEQTGPDLIVFHPKCYGGPHIAEKLGIPVFLAVPYPMFVPTGDRPGIGFPRLRLGRWGRWYNRTTYRLVNALLGLSVGTHVRSWRAAHGLPPAGRFDMLRTTAGRDIPVLHAYSRHVIPPPPDWPDTAHVTGYWFLGERDDWRPPRELADFLDRGPAPIYVGFGSMAGRNPRRLARAVVEALRQTGARGVIATGWGGMRAEDLPETVLCIDQAPHAWLFPRVAAVVHHGGAGTTAAGLRAGAPSIIVPFFGDQPFWGKRVFELGAGPAPIPQKRLTPERLAHAIRAVQTDGDLRRSAAALGERIRAEDGIRRAASILTDTTPGGPAR